MTMSAGDAVRLPRTCHQARSPGAFQVELLLDHVDTGATYRSMRAVEAEEIELKAGSDSLDARWMPMEVEKLHRLYASHGFFAIHALRLLCAATKDKTSFRVPGVWEQL